MAAALGGWWWIANWIREGQPAPTTETLTRTDGRAPAGFTPDLASYAWTFAGRLVSRTWAWVGFGNPKFDLPSLLVAAVTLAFVVVTLVALRHAGRGTATTPGLRPRRRRPGVAARRPGRGVRVPACLGPVRHDRTVRLRAGALPVRRRGDAGGGRRHRGRARPTAGPAWRCWLLAVVLQSWLLADVVRGSWTGDGQLGAVAGMLAWSPWPPAAVAGRGHRRRRGHGASAAVELWRSGPAASG